MNHGDHQHYQQQAAWQRQPHSYHSTGGADHFPPEGTTTRGAYPNPTPADYYSSQERSTAMPHDCQFFSRGGGPAAESMSFLPPTRGSQHYQQTGCLTARRVADQDTTAAATSPGRRCHGNSLVITAQPSPRCSVQRGTTITMHAEARDALHRRVQYQWYMERQPLPNETRNILVLHDVDVRQSGQYCCMAHVTELAGSPAETLLSDTTLLKVIEPSLAEAPTIVVQPQSANASRGSRLLLQCSAKAHPDASYRWYHNGVCLADQTQSRLSVETCREENVGVYMCEAWNDVGCVFSHKAEVRVFSSDQDSSCHPLILAHPKSVQVPVPCQQAIQLECLAGGAQPLYYQWYRNGGVLKSANAATLTLEPSATAVAAAATDSASSVDASGDDASGDQTMAAAKSIVGTYVCSVSNHFGVRSSQLAMVYTRQSDTILPDTHGSGPSSSGAYAVTSPSSPERSLADPDSHLAKRRNSSASSEGSTGAKAIPGYPQPLTLSVIEDIEKFSKDYDCQLSPIGSAPQIIQHPPVKLTLTGGSQLQLHCKAGAASGDAVAYQWYHISRDLETATLHGQETEQLDMRVNSADDSGIYYCRVTTGEQRAYSQPCGVAVVFKF